MIEENNIENKLFDLLQSIHKDKSILSLIKKIKTNTVIRMFLRLLKRNR